MRCLPYCLFAAPEENLAQPPPGVDGLPVIVLAEAGLAAAASLLPDSEPPPDIRRLVAFENVVEWFHHRCAVLPVRYGCFLEDGSRLREILGAHRDEYLRLLGELDGAVEMAIRILPETEPAPGLEPAIAAAGGSGAAFLALRRNHYDAADRAARQLGEIAGRLCSLLSGTFVRSRSEPLRAGLASVHFLVQREAVARFREAVRRVRGNLPVELLLSGPWPPYNFVDSLGEPKHG